MPTGKQQPVVDPEFATKLLSEAKKRGVADAVGFRQLPRTVEALRRLAADCKGMSRQLTGVVSKMPKDRQTEAQNIVAACDTFATALTELAGGNRQYAKNEYNL